MPCRHGRGRGLPIVNITTKNPYLLKWSTKGVGGQKNSKKIGPHSLWMTPSTQSSSSSGAEDAMICVAAMFAKLRHEKTVAKPWNNDGNFFFTITGEEYCSKEKDSDKVDTDDEGIEQDHCDEERSPGMNWFYIIKSTKSQIKVWFMLKFLKKILKLWFFFKFSLSFCLPERMKK